MFLFSLFAAALALPDAAPAPSPHTYSPLQCAALTTVTWREIVWREGKRSRDAKAMKALVKGYEKQARKTMTSRAYKLALEIEIEAWSRNSETHYNLPEAEQEKPFIACLGR